MADPFGVAGAATTHHPTDPFGVGSTHAKKTGGTLDRLGVVGNLIGDAADAIHGIPSGVKLAVTHPIAAAEGIGKSYAQTYGPLFHGDIKTFLHNIEQHPLGPVLDVLTLATLGAAGTARVGATLGRVGAISDTSRLARLGDAATLELRSPATLAGELGAGKIEKLTSRNPLIRARQQAVHGALGRLDYNAPIVGELARYSRALRRGPSARAQVLKQESGAYVEAYSKLSKNERTALGMLARVPLPQHLDEWKGMLAEESRRGNVEASKLLEQISKPKIAELYANPSKQMLRAHTEADKLGERSATELQRLGVLTPEEAQLARYRHSRIAGGATVYDSVSARTAVRRINGQLSALRKTGVKITGTAGKLRGKGTPELRAARQGAERAASTSARKTGTEGRASAALERVDRLHAELAKTNDQLLRLSSGAMLSSQELLDHGLKAGSNVDLFRARVVTRLYDRGTRLAAEYDRALEQAATKARINERLPSQAELAAHRTSSSAELAQARTDIASRLVAGRAELERIAQLQGKLVDERSGIRPGIVGGPGVDELRAQIEAAGRPQPIYMPDVPAAPKAAGERGGGAFSYGSPVHRGEGLLFVTGKLALQPDVLGPQFLRTVVFSHYRDLHDHLLDSAVKVPKGGKLPEGWVFVKRPVGLGDVPSLRELLPNPDDIPEGFANRGLTTGDSAEALIDHGARYAVPVKLARTLEAEFKRSNTAVRLILERPTAVWRALVLNLRVGWLTNNIVGNHLLYALRYAGPAGLRGYLSAIATTKGGAAVRQLLELPETQKALTQADIRELLPEQAGGTFLGTQAPNGRVGRVARKANLGLAKVDKATESTLRRAAVNAELRRNPAVRARLNAMPKETRSFRQASRDALAADPKLAREISDGVNSALGDFLSLSPFEQRYLRGIFPFYAWYKAITKIVGRLPIDAPGRSDIIAKLAQAGLDESNAKLGPLPSYLRGAIPLGGDELLKAQGFNPLETVNQLGAAAAVPFVPGARTNALAGIMNPFVQAGGALVFGKASTKNGLAADLLQGIITDLPQVTLARDAIAGPKPSKVYKPSALDDLLAYLGVPTKTINRGQAAKLASQGR